MDHIPLPPNGPSYSPSQITNSSSPESTNAMSNSSASGADKVPVLGKEKAKKRLLAFGKGISFGLKPRNKSIQSSRENPVTCNDEDDEKESSFASSSSLNPPSKKLNIDAIMEEEKEIAASRPSLSYIPPRLGASASTNVLSAVPQLIVPVLPPHAIVPPIPPVPSSSSASSSCIDKPGSPRPEDRHAKRSFHRRHNLSSDKYNDIVDIPSNWKSFKALGLQVYEPEFPKFKRQLDKEYDRLGNIESRKRTNLNIVKSGDEFIWKEYVKDPVASDCELAFRGLTPRIVQSYTKESMQDLLWDLDSDYHSKEFPKNANHKIKGRHSVTYCYHPRFYEMKYEQRKDIFHTDEETCKFELLLEILFKTKKDEEIDNSKFTSGSFVSKEVPSPIEHRQWYTKIENFMNDKETIFPEVLRARQMEGFVPSKALPKMESQLSDNYKGNDLKRDDSGEDSLEYSKKVDTHKSAISSDKRNKSKKKSSKRHLDEEVEDSDTPSKKASKRQKRECDETNGESVKKLNEGLSDSEHGEEKQKKKKKKKKKLKKSNMDPEFEDEDDDNVDSKSLKKKKKHNKKRKKRKKSKRKYERKDTASPLMDEAMSTDKSIGLCNIRTWEDPMKLTEITITAACDDDARSPSPPPTSSSRGAINTKDPRTRSLFAVAGYGYEDDVSSKRKNSCGPRTPSPKSSNSRGPRTPSPKSKSNWRPPSPRISPPLRPDDGSPPHSSRKLSRRRSRSRSYDRCSSGGHSRHSRSPSHHRRGNPHRRISRSPPRRSSHRYYRSPSPDSHYNGPNNPSYHMERSLADPTLSDADLPGYSSNLRQIYAYEDFSASSPKRLSLDERLEKELGINVREVHPPQDFSIPPPGYPVRPPPLVPSHPPPPILPHMLHQEPIHHHPPSSTLIPTSLPPPCLPHKDVPEEGRLVRVGNMLQIVPEAPQHAGPHMVPPPNDHVAAATAAAVAAAAAVTAALQEPKEAPAPAPQPAANTAVTLMRKMEEMKRQRDRERESKREQEKGERTNAVNVVEPVPTPKVEEEEQEQQQLPPSPLEENNQEDADEAKILQEAISSVPEMDDEYFTSSPNPIADSAPRSYKRKRQKATSNAAPNSQLHTPNNSLASVDDTLEDDEEWAPRSPVPLPDASTCKPILMQLGFSGREKKVLRYADGILPGQGSPDISDVVETGTNPSTDQQQSTSAKRRKKIRLKIISQKDQSLSDSPPPPPPSGSPPLHHYSTWLTRHMPLTT